MQGTPTKLSLDRFFRILGINPLHAWNVHLEEMSRNANQGPVCGTPIFQYDWQDNDRVGREEIARAIFEAEADIESVVGYRLMPSFEEDEWVRTIRPYRAEGFNLNSRDLRGFGQVIFPRWGHMISGGIRSVELLAASSAIAYSNDRPPTTYEGLATVTFTAAVELPDCEIAIYYPGQQGDERWRIRPIEVSHDIALTYTITFRREMGVIPEVLESYDLSELRGVDGAEDANFIAAVDVCRVYLDPQQQATLLWEGAGGCSSCNGAGCGVCGYGTQTGCLLLRGDPRLSQVVYHPAEWDQAALAFATRPLAVGRQPDIVRLWYYAGWRDRGLTCPTQELDADWARTVAYMAAARLDRPICACAKTQTDYWGADLAFSGGATEMASYRLTESDVGNPFGTRRGEIAAWRRVRRPGAAIRGVVANA